LRTAAWLIVLGTSLAYNTVVLLLWWLAKLDLPHAGGLGNWNVVVSFNDYGEALLEGFLFHLSLLPPAFLIYTLAKGGEVRWLQRLVEMLARSKEKRDMILRLAYTIFRTFFHKKA